jgi:hypothetical protein
MLKIFAMVGKDMQRTESKAEAQSSIADTEHVCSIHIATFRVIQAATPTTPRFTRKDITFTLLNPTGT